MCTIIRLHSLHWPSPFRLACLDSVQAPLNVDGVRYVAGCVICALERLHCRLGCVYRNLSTDAISVDENGCICLMDYRFAKRLVGYSKTFTLCGVADYLSPEQVTCSGHGLSADLWALGVLLWEVTAGEGPWGNEPNEVNIYRHITDHSKGTLAKRLSDQRDRGFVPPDYFVPTLVDLIDSLLVPEPLDRLGASADEQTVVQGFEALKAHPLFFRTKWDALIDGGTLSPLLTSPATHVREQVERFALASNDAVLSELMGTTEFDGDGSWFSQY